ncbi:cell division protein SepF [Streptococcus panodentis]|uniref:Cell division protein SepF n=1 Tax=Streptococcus panodentis TaxID=1581472 RepID=A0ABS5AYJ4_9STRE|nr:MULTISPECIES: cell division protein SepF [Streptococcus]KXT81696.1 FtsZ-interacting protein [Streptococcus sp. DD11]MBP2621501.1 cell division protein SepF [Streptococcus panodentis]
MSLKDRFDKFIDYFTEDGEETDVQERTAAAPVAPVKQQQKPALVQSKPAKENRPARPAASAASSQPPQQKSPTENITRLHARQQELAQHRANADEKITIDVRYPRKYEEATEIVDLLLANESILIDFQYMTEVQARRCLDYLDGARYVLAGNLKKVASTMYLLTPINVVVNVEDIRLPNDVELSEFDFDMKRSR